jgi:uncharacterized membrane protein
MTGTNGTNGTDNRLPGVSAINTSTRGAGALELLALAALGGALIGASARRGRTSGIARVAGLGLIGLAARPLIVTLITRAGARRRSLAFNASIEIGRPVSDVFAFFKDFENFPRVIGAVRSVIDHQDGRSHWEVYTPSGAVLAWDAVVTKYVPNSVIAWESVIRSLVESSGVARFTPLSTARTRVDLALTHHPLQTTLKDAVRALVAPHPSDQVHAHLEHIRFYLESLPSQPAQSPLEESAR